MVTRNVRRFAVAAALFGQLTACDGEAIMPCPNAGDARDASVADMAWRSPNGLHLEGSTLGRGWRLGDGMRSWCSSRQGAIGRQARRSSRPSLWVPAVVPCT